MKRKYLNDAFIGNRKMIASVSEKGELLRLSYPTADYRQFIDYYETGVKINDSALIRLHDDINNVYNQYYSTDTNVLNTEIENTYFKLNMKQEDLEKNIAYTTCVTAQQVKADAIVAYTHKGDSVRLISGMGPGCPIFAIADNESTYYQLSVAWNVTPILIKDGKTIEDTIQKGIAKLEEEGILEKGDKVVLAGGPKILPDATENKVIGGVARV